LGGVWNFRPSKYSLWEAADQGRVLSCTGQCRGVQALHPRSSQILTCVYTRTTDLPFDVLDSRSSSLTLVGGNRGPWRPAASATPPVTSGQEGFTACAHGPKRLRKAPCPLNGSCRVRPCPLPSNRGHPQLVPCSRRRSAERTGHTVDRHSTSQSAEQAERRCV